jgi:hypothetical protein
MHRERYTRGIKSRTAWAKAEFNKKRILFTRKLDLNFRKKISKCQLHLEHSFVCCWKLEVSRSRLEILGKTNGEVDMSHENTTMVVWIYDGV